MSLAPGPMLPLWLLYWDIPSPPPLSSGWTHSHPTPTCFQEPSQATPPGQALGSSPPHTTSEDSDKVSAGQAPPCSGRAHTRPPVWGAGLTVLCALCGAPPQAVLQQLVGAGGAGSCHQTHGGLMQEHLGRQG